MMSPVALIPADPQQGVLGAAQMTVRGSGFAVVDTATGARLAVGDAVLASHSVQIVDIIGLENFPQALIAPTFAAGCELRMFADADAMNVAVWDAGTQHQLGWLAPGVAPNVAARIASGVPLSAQSLWEWRSPDGRLRYLSIVVSPAALPIMQSPVVGPPPGQAVAPVSAKVERPRADTATGRGGIVAASSIIAVALIVAIVVNLFTSNSSSSDVPATTPSIVRPTTTTSLPTTTTVPITQPPPPAS